MWYYVVLYLLSLVTVTVPSPDLVGAYLISTFHTNNKVFAILAATTFDTINALFAYFLSFHLIRLTMRTMKSKHEFSQMQKFYNKYGYWFLFVAAATIVPFTLALYVIGTAEVKNKRSFLLVTFIGRLCKYIKYALLHRLGWEFIKVADIKKLLAPQTWFLLGVILTGVIIPFLYYRIVLYLKNRKLLKNGGIK